ncbi:MAG: alpha-galactosidase [Armatimonadota bacterium]|nr:alpha-galactosidase [Armatimonadota bacterium]
MIKIFIICTLLSLCVSANAQYYSRTGRWSLKTADTIIVFEIKEGNPVIVDLLSTAAKSKPNNWAVGTPEADLPDSVEIDGQTNKVTWEYKGIKQREGQISFTYQSKDPSLEYVSTWEAARLVLNPGNIVERYQTLPGPVEHSAYLVNKTRKTVILAPTATITLPLMPQSGQSPDIWWIEKTAGHVSDVGIHIDALTPGYEKTLRCGPYSQTDATRDAFPWFCVHDKESKCGVYGGVEFSGWTQILIKREPNAVTRVSMGLDQREGKTRTRLAPGEKLQFPTCFIGAYKGEVEDGTHGLHRWVEKHLRPPIPGGVTPLLVNNSWGSGMAVDEALAKTMIDDCADLGIEMYHVDAGWFKEVGDWHSHPEKFPNGLEKIADYTHSKDLKFGLWVGWTQGGSIKNPGPDVLSPFNPEQKSWFANDYPEDWKNAAFKGATACMGCEDARNWCLNDLRRMVKQYKLDLLEHDQNMILSGCEREGHGHIPNDSVDVSRAAAEGYYAVYDQLRKENPNLLFEDCVNGGRLFDFGVAKRAHYICMSDDFAALPLRKDFYDSSYPFPPSMLEAYIRNKVGDSVANFRYMLRSAMLGWCTIMTDMSKWTPEERAAAKREFAIYKDKLRPFIASGNVYHVLPRPDGKNWDGMQYADQKGDKGVLYVFRPQSEKDTQAVILRGLNPKKRYAIEATDGSASGTYTGEELMKSGLTVRLAEKQSSDLIFFNTAK